MAEANQQRTTVQLLRRGLLALAALGMLGTTTELLFLRHWSSATQLLAWPPAFALGVALVALVRRPGRRAIRAAQAIAVAVVLFAGVGMALHIKENLDAGALDRTYAATWDRMSGVEQVWLATTGGVGPAPVLAPGALAEIALMLLLATWRHERLRGD